MRIVHAIWLVVTPLAACDLGDRALTGECPADDVCSDATPDGLNFDGAVLSDDLLFGLSAHPTVVGGTQQFRLESLVGSAYLPLELPFRADDGDAAGVQVEAIDGATVTVRGVAAAGNYLRITDPEGALYDRKFLEAVALRELRLVPSLAEHVEDGDELAFAAGRVDVTVAVFGERASGDEIRAVDESLDLVPPAEATRVAWDRLAFTELAVGSYEVAATPGGGEAEQLVLEVAAPEVIELQPLDGPLRAGEAGRVCFSARTGGRHVAGLDWTFTATGARISLDLFPNCALVIPDGDASVAISALAGGLRSTATIDQRSPARAARIAAPDPQRPTTLGERAADFLQTNGPEGRPLRGTLVGDQ